MSERLYLIGHPVAHSKSPVMHNAVYSHAGLDWTYESLDFPCEQEACAFLDARDFLAVNITTPYKPLAYSVATQLSPSAQLAFGANALIKNEDTLLAFNLDGMGCAAFLEYRGISLHNASVVVCGSGPTSLAIAHACAWAGASHITLAGRNASRTAQALNRSLAEYEKLVSEQGHHPLFTVGDSNFPGYVDLKRFSSGSYDEVADILASADLIIDATPLGMNTGDPAPIDTTLLHAGQVVYDVVYGHGETALAAAARNAGCEFYDGAGMLVMQAVLTVETTCAVSGYELCLGRHDMFDIMTHAAGFDI